MRKVDMQAVVWKEGRHYVSQCLNIDVASHGTTAKKALENLKEAVELYLEDRRMHKPCRVMDASVVKMKFTYA